ncbi:MAG: D-amino-acid transaminase [Gammaproteobacteria bacterium]|nr:MAG: D-amino-acid transaminase [Gammaproteobacteria bacterium]
MNQVYLNGDFLPAEQAQVSVFDRGFLLGDGVYEVIPVYQGNCFQLDGHLVRLQASLDAVRMKNPHSNREWEKIINELIKLNGDGNQSLYLQVTRGVAPRDHVFPENVSPTAFAMSNPLQAVSAEYKNEGVKAIILADIRWQNCNVKAITLLPNSLLKQQALEAGAVEALLIREGYLTEGAASNAYVVLDGTIYTAPKDEKVLAGITRDVVIQIAHDNNMPLKEVAVTVQQLKEADEIWISSSTKEVIAVTQLDDSPVANGKPGPIWQKMDALYQQFKRSDTT